VYHGPKQKAWEEVSDPDLTDDGDIIVQVDAATICGTDLHILRGDVPEAGPHPNGRWPRPDPARDRHWVLLTAKLATFRI
jgi:threonine dehydrogenase-like Zn-dependent dehydrogenase